MPSARNITQREVQTVNEKFSAYPNPFSNKVNVSFKAEEEGPVNVSVYDMNGKLVSTAYDGIVQKGSVKQIEIKTDRLPAGIYLFNLKTPSGVVQRKLVLTR
jgi:hypothetical protein